MHNIAVSTASDVITYRSLIKMSQLSLFLFWFLIVFIQLCFFTPTISSVIHLLLKLRNLLWLWHSRCYLWWLWKKTMQALQIFSPHRSTRALLLCNRVYFFVFRQPRSLCGTHLALAFLFPLATSLANKSGQISLINRKFNRSVMYQKPNFFGYEYFDENIII